MTSLINSNCQAAFNRATINSDVEITQKCFFKTLVSFLQCLTFPCFCLFSIIVNWISLRFGMQDGQHKISEDINQGTRKLKWTFIIFYRWNNELRRTNLISINENKKSQPQPPKPSFSALLWEMHEILFLTQNPCKSPLFSQHQQVSLSKEWVTM